MEEFHILVAGHANIFDDLAARQGLKGKDRALDATWASPAQNLENLDDGGAYPGQMTSMYYGSLEIARVPPVRSVAVLGQEPAPPGPRWGYPTLGPKHNAARLECKVYHLT